jgi:hypothetical protein
MWLSLNKRYKSPMIFNGDPEVKTTARHHYRPLDRLLSLLCVRSAFIWSPL